MDKEEKREADGWIDTWRDKWEGEIMSHGWRRSSQQLYGQAVNHTEGATFRERKAKRR